MKLFNVTNVELAKYLYICTNEFRNAVKRFLRNVATSMSPTVLNLYSGESLKWMTEDKTFLHMENLDTYNFNENK